ncbi:biotin transporter BioY [Halopiger goleimassiliensis]|uniref:biotin transporter BioY n=1 Tax=Halopiger goleimassiliensis TaxID=1293048 RepID=UPI0006776ADC|nr:biotin transporter BioY [Halopiger goleimassiliensis]
MATERSDVELVDDAVVRQFARAALVAALMGATAPIEIPISAVPGTLQMLVVFLAGLYLGPVWGPISMVIYLAAGAAGAPVFSGTETGIGVLLGQTGGFLWSFPVGALHVGVAVHRGTDLRDPANVSVPVVLAGLVMATIVVYLAGFTWFAVVTETTLTEAFTVVAAPLIPGDLLKMVAAVAIVRTARIQPVGVDESG